MSQLPTLADLHRSPGEAYKNDRLKEFLNQPCHHSWVKNHPMVAGAKYLPIDKVEWLMDVIFQDWRVEVIRFDLLLNSVAVQVRLHYKNPLTGEWSFHDGVGAVGIQTDKGASAANLGAIKNDAIMKALPAAESYAVKDAAEKLGDIFGKNLNRRDTVTFAGGYSQQPQPQPQAQYEPPQQNYYSPTNIDQL